MDFSGLKVQIRVWGFLPSFFTQFICSHAKTEVAVHTMKDSLQNFKTPVSVHKTEISHGTFQDKIPSKDDPAKYCPIHNKPHSSRKCGGFRLKTI